jgi:2-oxo-4-hydroxy-4-carboxy-5-ureidoimidazoline decarboxylase
VSEAHRVLNALSDAAARQALERCCAAHRWVTGMLRQRPFESAAALFTAAEQSFAELGRDDYLEAFAHHPQIGASLADLRARFPETSAWSSEEQASVTHADDRTLLALHAANADYLARFGHIFIVCASGKTAAEMLSLLEARLDNAPDVELRIAAAEQAKITRLRLEKLAP